MKNTGSTPDLSSLPSPQQCLRPFCWLVWSDSHYFLRNHTISSMKNLLHNSHYHWKKGRWQFCEWKLFSSDCQSIYSLASLPHRCACFCLFSEAHLGLMVMFHNPKYRIQRSAGICNWSWMRWAINLEFLPWEKQWLCGDSREQWIYLSPDVR